MKTVGITGGIGVGKTKVLDCLREDFGAYILETDKLAHRLMQPGGEIYIDIVNSFGREILDNDELIDRKKLGAIVFSSQEKLKELNEIVHPGVKSWILRDMDEQEELGTELYVIEAALLIQDGYKEICDELWSINADLKIRIDRLMEYRGYSLERALEVISNQPPEEYYLENTVRHIYNNSDEAALKEEVGRVFRSFQEK